MRITFDNLSQVNIENSKPERIASAGRTTKAATSYQVAFDGKDRVGFGIDANAGRNKNIVQLPLESAETDVQNMRNQLTVMSHTMSDEDFAKMQKEGYDPADMKPEEAVTILDKIKSELVKAGVHVEGYTDSLDMDTLAAAMGSEALARSVAESFAYQDIPMEQSNVDKVLNALNMAEQIGVPDESTYYYMAANNGFAVLRDFYFASASGSKVELEQNSQYFGEAVKGYITKNVGSPEEAGSSADLNIEDEIDKLMERQGLEASQEERKVAAWLIEKGLPAEKATIERMKEVFAVPFPLREELVIQTAAAAIADGISVEEKNLADPTSNLEKAVALYEKYQGDKGLALVQDRRMLEEVRLHMTVETNLKLLQSGFSIDTAPIEETIEALKNIEQELAKQYFPQDNQAGVKYQQFKETGRILQELPKLPAATIGSFAERTAEGTLEQFHGEGKALEAALRKAGESYETMGTAPRADLGDHIRKAFAGVDALLEECAYELTEENRKAVRILGYNRMEITPENIERIKEATRTVDRVVEEMTPAATLKMIRDGVNPLEATLLQLEEYFESLPQDYAQETEKYSRFLYRLEQTGQLTETEKEAFIGCYRLLRQVEKSDGAAIGALVNSGAELNFSNLLSAVRSGHFKGLDAKVDDSLGALSEEAYVKFSISEQIQAGFGAEQREAMKEAAKAPAQAFEALERGQMEPTAENVLAVASMEQKLREVLTKQEQRIRSKEAFKESWQKLSNKEEFLQEYEGFLQETIENVEENTFKEADSTVDVRQLQLFHKQLHIMQSLEAAEEYYFSMEIGGELTGIHLQFEESEEGKGLVRMTLESEKLGRLAGALQVQNDRVEGYFVGNQEEAVMKLRKSSDIVNKNLGEEWKFCEVEFIHSESNHIPMDWTRKSTETQVSNDSLYRLTKNFLQAVKAVGDNA